MGPLGHPSQPPQGKECVLLFWEAEGTPSVSSCSKGRPRSGRLEDRATQLGGIWDPASQSWGEHVHEPPLLARRPQVPRLGAVPLTEFCHDSFSRQPECSEFLGEGCKGGPGAGGGVRK